MATDQRSPPSFETPCLAWLLRTRLELPERLEHDDRAGVLNTGNHLHLFVDEVTDVGRILNVELHQEVEVAGGRIDLRSDLGIRERVRYLVGFAEMAFDLHEKRNHPALPKLSPSIQQNHARLASRTNRR